jgi:hypothetical protein
MPESVPAVLAPWSNFAIMTASAAAALTGLMFVVITLVSGERRQNTPDGISTFSTPTVVHFAGALLVSALLVVPWPALGVLAVALGIVGLYGMGYAMWVTRGMQRLPTYRPDLEDQVWHSGLPLVAYAAMLAGAIGLHDAPAIALFAVAAGNLTLIFIGIHNAWDIVTYLAAGGLNEPPSST